MLKPMPYLTNLTEEPILILQSSCFLNPVCAIWRPFYMPSTMINWCLPTAH